MSVALVLGLVLAVVGGVARWRVVQWHASPLGQANIALERGRRRRWRWRPPTRLERLHAVQWSVLVVVGILFLAWAALPLVAEYVGAFAVR